MKIAIDAQVTDWFDSDDVQSLLVFDANEFDDVRNESAYDFIISREHKNDFGLQLLQRLGVVEKNSKKKNKKPKYLSHQINIEQFIKQNQSSFPASKKTLFSQAVGRKTQTVIDVTGGWLGDTLLMCSQNYQVKVLERHWILSLIHI